MTGEPPRLPDEAARQELLDGYCVLDTPPEPGFDNITRLAAHFFDVPVALVSLVDRDRQWFKSRVGLEVTETRRCLAFCAHAIAGDAVFLVPDATRDPRFRDNPLVTGPPDIRFYAGAPLIAGGHRLGTLCVIDTRPRDDFGQREAETLQRLATLVVDELDLRREVVRRQRAESDLRERSRLLNLAEEIGEFGHWYLDLRTGVRRWSDEVYRIYGYEPGTVTPSADIVMNASVPEDRDKVRETMARGASGEGFEVERRLVRPDGSIREVVTRGVAEFDADGKPVGVLGVIQDVTDRRRHEAELLSSRELLELTFQATRDGLWDWELRTGRIWFSPTWKEQLGYRDDELENSLEAWAGLIFEEDRTAALAMVEDYNAGRIPTFEMVQRFRHKDGHTVYILSRAIHVRDADGTVVRMVGAHTDITREKQSEEALRLAEQNLRDAIEAIPEGLTIFDADDRLILCNRRYLEAHPKTAPAIVPGASFESILRTAIANGEFGHDPQGGGWNEEFIRAELAQHRRIGPAFERQLPDGRWLLIAENRTAGGGIVSTRTDITERKRFEEELQRQAADMCALAEGLDTAREDADEQRARAEAATRAKSEFLAAMSHEIRTPMNGVIGMTELLLDTGLTAEQRQFAEAVRSSANALLAIINDILDFSKLEAGRVEIEAAPYEPADVVEGVVELLAPRAREKGIEIGFYIDPALRRPVIGDATRVRQILVNLVGNAVKFTESGWVEVEMLALPDPAGPTVLRIDVTDTGIGIPSEAQATLFTKFQQVDGSITRRYGGTGLGLAICKQLAELMGGTIAVESAPGQGSRFRVEIPLTVGEETGGESGLPAMAPLAGRRVLVVDDLEISRRVVSSMLEGLGAAVTVADGAFGALDALYRAAGEGLPFDVALVDQTMPVMSGEELILVVSTRPDLAATRMVLLTSVKPGGGSRAAALPHGAAAVLSKPLRLATLANCLNRLFGAICAPAEPERPGPGHGERMPEAGRSGHILLAEDNRTNRLFATTLLQRLGYTVTVAEDGLQAVEAAQAGRFDLILMDVQMPGMDGLEATQAIRAGGGPAAGLPIIALTADAMAGTRDQCLAAGMDDYIAKPINRTVLLSALDRWLPPAVPAAALAAAPAEEAGEGLAEAEDEVLDRSVLAELAKSVGPCDLAVIVGSFLEDIARRLERLTAIGDADRLKAADLRALAGEAHDLSSTAGSFGGIGVMHLAWRMEVCCRNGDLAQARELLPNLLAEVRRLERALARLAPMTA